MNWLMRLFRTKVPRKQIQQLLIKGAVIIDVRSPKEFSANHLPSAVNIPLQSLLQKSSLYTKQPVIIVCRTGNLSSMGTALLKNAGIEAYDGGKWERLYSLVARQQQACK